MDNKFIRWNVKKHDPADRCHSSNGNGQCPYVKDKGSNYCPRHGSNNSIINYNQEVQRNYRLNRWQQRVEEFSDSSKVKDLREEVGILRMMLEEMLNKCRDTTDLLLYSHRISDLVVKIEKLVVSCDRLEGRMGLLLSKDAVLQLASTFVEIINTHIPDAETIELISDQIIDATQTLETIDAA